MMEKQKKLLHLFYLTTIIILAAFLRFYKLDWGNGFFFHPDEYHIVGAVERISFPHQMNPGLFSYGSFTVYLIYFVKSIFSLETSTFLVGRYLSAFFSTLTVYITYLISREIFSKKFYHYLSAFLVSILPGIVQQAHYTTPESILTFWLLTTVLLWLKWLKLKKLKIYILSAITLGLALGTKVTSVVFLPVLFLLPFLKTKKQNKLFRNLFISVTSILTSFATFFLVFPHSILDSGGFLNSIRYETGVGQGKYVVFYTRQFIETVPIKFQLEKILPFALGPAVLVFGILGFVLILREIYQTKRKDLVINYPIILFVISFCLLFLPNSFLFAKWTRFITPTFPFFCIFTSYFVLFFEKQLKHTFFKKNCFHFLVLMIISVTSIWSMMFFSIYLKKDVREMATQWINENIPENSYILTETGNTLEVPLKGKYHKVPFDFYELEHNQYKKSVLISELVKSEYFIVQSRRVFANHQRLDHQYPLTSHFYDLLFSGNLGFEKIKEIESFPELRIGNYRFYVKDENAEETWAVFDHPVIGVFKKTSDISVNEYEILLEIGNY